MHSCTSCALGLSVVNCWLLLYTVSYTKRAQLRNKWSTQTLLQFVNSCDVGVIAVFFNCKFCWGDFFKILLFGQNILSVIQRITKIKSCCHQKSATFSNAYRFHLHMSTRVLFVVTEAFEKNFPSYRYRVLLGEVTLWLTLYVCQHSSLTAGDGGGQLNNSSLARLGFLCIRLPEVNSWGVERWGSGGGSHYELGNTLLHNFNYLYKVYMFNMFTSTWFIFQQHHPFWVVPFRSNQSQSSASISPLHYIITSLHPGLLAVHSNLSISPVQILTEHVQAASVWPLWLYLRNDWHAPTVSFVYSSLILSILVPPGSTWLSDCVSLFC